MRPGLHSDPGGLRGDRPARVGARLNEARDDLQEALPVALGLMCVAYSLVAASRNMMFATALMLSKEAASGGPGVAIGINQSACSLGSALGPMVTGAAYTQSLRVLHSCTPFFLGVGLLGALPGLLTIADAPPWPWRLAR